jgi:hypothetical protein
MSKQHHNPQRNSMMPAPNPTPRADTQVAAPDPTRVAYVVDRIGSGWRLRVCELPESVVSAHVTTEHEPDVYAITSSRMGGYLDERAMRSEQ